MTLQELEKLKGKKAFLALSDDEKRLFDVKEEQLEVIIVKIVTKRVVVVRTSINKGHKAGGVCEKDNCWFAFPEDLTQIEEGVK